MTFEDKLVKIAENEQKLYEAGQKGDYDNGYNEGKADGIQSEYDRFWDNFQNYGNRGNYRHAFGNFGWNSENFRPKYDIIPTESAEGMFYYNTEINDLVTHLENCGIELDTSKATNLNHFIFHSTITHVGILSTVNCSSISSICYYAEKLITVEKLILKTAGTQTLGSQVFQHCSELQNLTVEGKIGKSISFQWSKKLTHDSLMSILNALYDYSGSSTTHTCTLGATNLAKLTDAEKTIATEKGWTLA